jgi:hypothetical protein
MVTDFGYPRACRFRKTLIENRLWLLPLSDVRFDDKVRQLAINGIEKQGLNQDYSRFASTSVSWTQTDRPLVDIVWLYDFEIELSRIMPFGGLIWVSLSFFISINRNFFKKIQQMHVHHASVI